MNDEELHIINFKAKQPIDAATGMATKNTAMMRYDLEHPTWGQGVALTISVLDLNHAGNDGIPVNLRMVLTFPVTADLMKDQVVDNGGSCKAAELITVDNNITATMPNKESLVYDQMITCIADGYWGLVGAGPSNEFAEELRAQYELMGRYAMFVR